ncbi:MAG: hypothetical protein ABSC48_13365 [Terracidiphilus sp.]|jgi:hypothetical protein
MKQITKIFFASLLTCVAVFPALAANTHTPAHSSWKLNLKESDFGGGPVLKSEVETYSVDTDKWLTWSDVTVDDKGQRIKSSWSGPADGTMHPVKGIPGAMAGWNSATDTDHAVMPDGTVFDETMTMPDPNKIVFKVTVTDKAGNTVHQTLVYDRTK